MSPSLPPIAFMMPISRVRSRIDITIVFMIPSDDTASAMDPIRLRTMSRMMKADDRLAVALVEIFEQAQNVARSPAVEIAGRFVGEQQMRLVGQRSRDGHALLLSPG